MKKISYLFLSLATILFTYGQSYAAESVTFDDGTVWSCDQSFSPRTVRFGYYYNFFDTFTNNNVSTYNNYINTYAVQYKNANYLGVGGAFGFTPELKALNYTVAPQQTVKILATADSNWRILRHPATRSTGGASDFMIGYKIGFDTSNNYPDASDDKYHVECQPYQVTWCGDGVLDSAYEKCDDGAANGLPGKCNVSCDATLPPDEKLTCDQTFPVQSLRYGNDAYFYDTYTNNDTFAHHLKKFDVLFTEPYDYNASTTFPTFDWTDSLKSANYIVPAGTQRQKVIEAKTPYSIRAVPPKRGADNLMVKYRIYTENAEQTSTVTTHVECQPYEISWCGDGILDTGYGEICDPAAPGQSATTCDPVTCKPKTDAPKCSSSLSGTLTTPITAGQCDVGVPVPGSFKDVVDVNGVHQYTWVCAKGGVDFSPGTVDSCSANYKPTTPVDLIIKKYVKTISTTGDSETAPVQVALGETFNYYYQFENTTASGIANVMIKDTFPEYLSYTGNIVVTNAQGVDVTSDWTITRGTYPGTTRITLLMQKKTPLPANSGKYTVTIPVTLSANAPVDTSMRNVAYICGENTTPVTGPNGEVICGNTNPPPPPPPSCTPENNPHKDPACIIVGSPGLTIKKYVNNADAQTASGAVVIASGAVYSYSLVVTNNSTGTIAGAKVVDTMPSEIEIMGVPTGTDWTCALSGQTITCLYNKALVAGAVAPTITVSAKIRPTAPMNTPIRNVAAVCVRDPSKPTTDPANNCTPDPEPCQPTNPNYNPTTGKCDPATVIVGGLDLAIKKYIETNDAQPGSPVSKNTNEGLNYIIRVQNVSSVTATGTTTVRDTLPVGVTASGAATGTNWTCGYSGTTLTCTTLQQVGSGAYFTDITVPVKVTAGANTTVINYAIVHNPNETNPCYADNRMPGGNETACEKDSKNIDPAVLVVPGGGGGGGSYWYTPKCINNVYTCETVASSTQPSGSYATFDLCKNALGSTYGGSCGSGGNGGGGGGGFCGDGVLQVGEECDVRGAAWCDAQCKVTFTTNPGANPIMNLSIKIPGFSTLGSQNFGLSRPFSEHRVVVGRGTPVFTLADTVALDIQTKYQIPVMIPADRLFCLSSSDARAVGMQTLCNPISRYITPTTINGQSYVVLGSGDYQVRQSDGKYILTSVSNPVNSVTIFKGFDLSQTSPENTNLSLRDAFVGIPGTPGSTSDITLYNRNPVVDPSGAIDLATFQVRLSSAIVGTTGTPVNRSIETFVRTTPASIVSGFLGNVSTTTTTSTTTNTTGSMNNIAVNGAIAANATVKTVAELEKYALNGNKNILAIKGSLTVENCDATNSTFSMDGIRTVIVEGNITFKCNTSYADATSSWAWIAKNGNIIIDNGDGTVYKKGITNLAGVYVAIGDTISTGQFTPLDGKTTSAILKIDGSLYGNANPLFNSRLYARGTSAYDILTAGTIITYSNRALINPPPLLSQYLSNYQVERVVK